MLSLLAAALLSAPFDDAACTMTDTGGGSGLFNIEMHSTHLIQPFKQIHCSFSSSDPLQSFTGSDPSGQCDKCVRTSGFSALCSCKCPIGPAKACSFKFTGHMQFPKNSTGTKSCSCGHNPPAPPTPPKPPPPKPPTPPAPPPPCKAKLDVVVVLDGSASIQDADWQHALTFTNQIVDSFNISADQAEVGAIQFSGPLLVGKATKTIIDLSTDAAAIKAAVSSTVQMKDGTNTYAGFHAAQQMLDTKGRQDAKGKIVILITDGDQTQGQPAKIAADALKTDKATIFGIGVGSQIDKQKIEQWVSAPATQHYFPVQNFASLHKILNNLIKGACPPPPVA